MRSRLPSDALLHPIALAAVAVLLVNDHFLKRAVPSVVTGKVSDVAGLVFFPLLLLSLVEVVRAVSRVSAPVTQSAVAGLVLATGAVFTAVKVSPPAAHGYSHLLGVVRWPFFAAAAIVVGDPLPSVAPLWVRADPTDLLALPALWIAWRICRRAAIQVRGAASAVAV